MITEKLGVQASMWQRSGEAPNYLKTPESSPWKSRPAMLNAWFLSSDNHVESRDVRRHIDWVLDQIVGASAAVLDLQKQGCAMELSCYWASAVGHGGPLISPLQMRKLVMLNLELGFDIYEPDDDSAE